MKCVPYKDPFRNTEKNFLQFFSVFSFFPCNPQCSDFSKLRLANSLFRLQSGFLEPFVLCLVPF